MYGSHSITQTLPAHDTCTMLGAALRKVFKVDVDDQFDRLLARFDDALEQEVADNV